MHVWRRVKITGWSRDRFLPLVVTQTWMVQAKFHVPGKGHWPRFLDLAGYDLSQIFHLLIHGTESGSG